MEEIKIQKRNQKNNLDLNWNSFFIKPLLNGIWGFFLFLVLVIFVKFLASLVNLESPFIFKTEDLYLSGIGFVLLFLIKFLENFRIE